MGHFLNGLADLARSGAKSEKVAVLDARGPSPGSDVLALAHCDYQSQQSFCLILKLV